jgi:hypothetical protein
MVEGVKRIFRVASKINGDQTNMVSAASILACASDPDRDCHDREDG